MSLAPKKIYGLVGYPIKHSLSPAMHNAAFAALGINAEYRLFELRESDLEHFLKSLPEKEIFGLNVTVPYKEEVVPFLDKIWPEARLIGAVNTINVSGDKLQGFNTDGEGFLRHLREDLQFSPEGKTISIIGAGGAAKAVAVYLSKTRPGRIAIYDLDKDKTKALVRNLRGNYCDIEFQEANSLAELNIQDADLLINATAVGMKEDEPCLVEEGLIRHGLLVYDLIYNPRETKLLRMAKEKGALASNGLGMLLYQGMLSFEIWTGKKAPKEAMQKPLRCP